MVRTGAGEDTSDDLDRIADASGAIRENWQRTIEDARAMAADREEDGFETLFVPAGDTTPKSPDASDTDEWGLSYVLPSNKADAFDEVAGDATFDETAVYQNAEAGTVFIVTECLDLDASLSVLVAGAYRMRFAPDLVRTALEQDRMYTHLKRLDGTPVASIEHERPDSFFPAPEAFYAYETDEMYGRE